MNSNKKYKISILMTCFNEEKYIADAVNSCIKQKLDDDKELEIIVGDDGSTDSSLKILEMYKKKYPKIFNYFKIDRQRTSNFQVPLLRQSNVYREALNRCSGDFIQFLDGDDLLIDENKINSQANFLINNSSFGCIFTDYKIFKDNSLECQDKKIVVNNYSGNCLWCGQYVHASCFLFRNEIKKYLLKNIISDIGIVYSGLCIGKCYHIPSFSFGYRKKEKSMSDLGIIDFHVYEYACMRDCMCARKHLHSTLARFNSSISYILKNYRKFIQNDNYHEILKETSVVSKLENDDYSIKRFVLYIIFLVSKIEKGYFKIYNKIWKKF